MAKMLKVGAVSRGSGEWFILLFVVSESNWSSAKSFCDYVLPGGVHRFLRPSTVGGRRRLQNRLAVAWAGRDALSLGSGGSPRASPVRGHG